MERAGHLQSGKVFRIALIEDSLDSVHTMAALLREFGHVVDYGINGYVALDLVRRFRPDCVMLDLGLPGMTGFEVCQQIKADPELGGMSVIAVTAYSDEKYKARARQVGFDGYYVKPVALDTLAALFGQPRMGLAATSAFHAP